ncbi:MAG: FAD-binding oxidoreductase [Pseudomonadota bacterium]
MVKSADCLVLGAGMVGVCTALHLQKRGRDVVLIDRQPAGEGTSFGNAGIIQAEGIVPYMLPLDALRLFQMLLNRRDEAHVHYRALAAFAPWLARYGLNSFDKAITRTSNANVPLIERCVSEHEALMTEASTVGMMRRTGFLKVFRDTGDLEAAETADTVFAERYGINFEVINPDRLSDMEPHLSDDLVGGIWYPDPVSLGDPSAAVKAYADLFRTNGGRFLTADARTLQERAAGGWQIKTVDGPIEADHAVLTLGPWSADLLSNFGVDVPLAPKRGYHMHYTVKGNATLQRPVVDTDHGYVLTTMTDGIRLTTGAEFAARDAKPTPKQLAQVEPHARALFPLEDRIAPEPWMGARPCLPDMLPMIGPVPRKPGLWANFGHHHLGLTLGAVSGRLIADLVTGEAPFADPAPYRVDRF